MMKTLTTTTVGVLLSCWAVLAQAERKTPEIGPLIPVKPWENLGPRPAPDMTGLKVGMSLKEFERILGVRGEPRPNPAPDAAIVDFDFDRKWVLVTVPGWLPAEDKSVTGEPESKVKEFRVITDELTAGQRQAERWKKWDEWVKAHSPNKKAPERYRSADALPRAAER